MWTNFSGFLKSELDGLKSKNPQFSLRSFARFLSVDSSLLSKIITEKRRPSKALIESVCLKLNVPQDQKIEFVKMYHTSKKPLPRKLAPQNISEYAQVTPNIFRSVQLLSAGVGLDETAQNTGENVDVLKAIQQMIQESKVIYSYCDNNSADPVKELSKNSLNEIATALNSENLSKNLSIHSSVIKITPENMEQVKDLTISFLKKLTSLSLKATATSEDYYVLNIGLLQCEAQTNNKPQQELHS